ncbi:MAG: tetratricopeptide repeat protein [Lentisphaerae bacterium]|jgi:cellulose synthase operon protein C|nr:tetratricopeptide repeat protein [Lentisphaerota bacterium]MBT4821537.1 tetratricopeptide repeat protein [Lentisphaerota bacterium]MBT5606550.1 tetratricopeptide repeat protein [Lentisphaerota bacterium]MBT7053459.1 tetratricopeptide repeat protein [Lentisphaerota bacterium]MBT7846798.1 tetratricopeptide repeat protein [Lentisphaerota bacterium]
MRVCALVIGGCGVFACLGATAVGLERLQTLFADGVYGDVIRRAGSLDLEMPPERLLGRHELVIQAAFKAGRYEEAIERTAALIGALPSVGRAWALRAEALLHLGRHDQAREAVRKALHLEPGGVSSQLARLHLARLTGDQRGARRAEDFFFGLYREARELTAEELRGIGEAAGREDPHGAWKAFQEAHERDPLYVPAYISAGYHCLAFFSWDKARGEFDRALGIWPLCPDARSGRAAVSLALGEYEDAAERLAGALEVNPHHAVALQQKAVLLALEGNFRGGLDAVREGALPGQCLTPTLLATEAELLDGLRREVERDQVLQTLVGIDPRPAFAYASLARARARQRSFPEAVGWGRKAIEADSRHWEGYYEAGINLLRLGEEREGRRLLDRSFRLNPFNVWAYNTLNVVDRDLVHREYVYHDTPHFRVKLHRRDDEVLWPYLEMWLESAYEQLSKAYGVEPVGPRECGGRLLLLILQTYEAFSARTAGLPGLGALGACFGQVITMPSPRLGRVFETHRGNWQRVLIHELTHVMTLQRSRYRVSRWLTEGLSQREEGATAYISDPLLARAWNAGQLPGLADLERAFTRPQFAGQLALSYQQALLAVRLLEKDHGGEAFGQLLGLLAEGTSEKDALQEVTGRDMGELDQAYALWLSEHAERVPYLLRAGVGESEIEGMRPATPQDWLDRAVVEFKRKKYEEAFVSADAAIALEPTLVDAHVVRGLSASEGRQDYDLAEECFTEAIALDPSCFFAHLHLGLLGVKSDRVEMAIRELEIARQLYPRYHPEKDSPYTVLVELYVEAGERRKAVEVMRDLRVLSPGDGEAARGYARLLRRSGAPAADVAEAFQDAVWTDPFDVDMHLDAAEAWEKAGAFAPAWREFCAATAIRGRCLDGWLGRSRVALAQEKKQAGLDAVVKAAELGAGETDLKRIREQLERLPTPVK